MSNLKTEYTDAKSRTHKVAHSVLPANDDNSREQIVEELFRAMRKAVKRVPA